MIRYLSIPVAGVLLLLFVVLGIDLHWTWFIPAALSGGAVLVGFTDLIQTRHAILRNYPITGHFRWFAEDIRPEIQQYFVERDTDGEPFNHDERSLIYERAKNTHAEAAFGTELNVYAPGYEWFTHSIASRLGRGDSAADYDPDDDDQFRVVIGGPQCSRPYGMSLFNISAMSFGSLSGNAIRALSGGARKGGFAHDTGEGGLTRYHLEPGGDLIWEIGTAYFGCRTLDGAFDSDMFTEKAAHPNVKCVSVKLSQGAKPGLGGVMPAEKVTQEIADIRGVPVGKKCISPPSHTAFNTPRGLLEFIHMLREASGGKPTGFKLCVGRRSEFLGICKAMLETGIQPDFIVVDGGEGGTGAAPQEFEDHVGSPLSDGLVFVHSALTGCGLRDTIKIGCSGKIISGFEMARHMAQGADYCNAARGMMFALGCIQAMRCQTNRCPVGITTQDPKRTRALVVSDKTERVYRYHRNTILSFNQLIASLGLDSPDQLHGGLLMRRMPSGTVKSYAQIYPPCGVGALLHGDIPEDWQADWDAASPDSFS